YMVQTVVYVNNFIAMHNYFAAPQLMLPNTTHSVQGGIPAAPVPTAAKPKMKVVVDPKYDWIAGSALRYDIF
ncbi:MAG: hypothetical protein OEU46_16595, partial [Alphaproteobacteria bacterium]|nr:hypothetical protein [Alphaproteobacteria bacterium]